MAMKHVFSSARLVVAVALVATLGPTSSHGQLRYDKSKVIPKNDPISPLLADYLAKMRKSEDEQKSSRSTYLDWIKVDAPAAAKLFPNLRFAALRWDMNRHPQAKGPVSLALGLEMVLAIDTTTYRLAKELWVYGNHEAYGQLLSESKVTLRNADEAKLVWDASREIYGQGSDAAPRKISDSEWRMGVSSYDQTTSVSGGVKTVVTRTHYMRVLVDPKTGQITSSELKVDSSKPRTMPAK
jgi:hypothetical protein